MHNFICWNTPGVLSFILMTICSVKKCDAKFAFSLNLTQIFKRTVLDSDRGNARHRVILFLLQNWPRHPKQIFHLNCKHPDIQKSLPRISGWGDIIGKILGINNFIRLVGKNFLLKWTFWECGHCVLSNLLETCKGTQMKCVDIFCKNPPLLRKGSSVWNNKMPDLIVLLCLCWSLSPRVWCWVLRGAGRGKCWCYSLMLFSSQSDWCLATQDKTNNKYCQKKKKDISKRRRNKCKIRRNNNNFQDKSDNNKSFQTPFNFKQSLGLIYKMFRITCQIFELYTMKYYNKI